MNFFRILITAFILGILQISLYDQLEGKAPFLIITLALYLCFYLPESYLPAALFTTGIIHDLFLGIKFGSSAISFMIIGILLLYLTKTLKSNTMPVKFILAFVALLFNIALDIFILFVSSETYFSIPTAEAFIYPIFITLLLLFPLFYLYKSLGIVPETKMKSQGG